MLLKHFMWKFANLVYLLYHMIKCHINRKMKPVICFKWGYNLIFITICWNFVTDEGKRHITMNRTHKRSCYPKNRQLRSTRYLFYYHAKPFMNQRKFKRNLLILIKSVPRLASAVTLARGPRTWRRFTHGPFNNTETFLI